MIIKNCDAQTFVENLNNRKVICFGAGTMLKEKGFLMDSNIENLENYIAFFIDNDNKKNGLEYEYNDKKFKIYSIDILNKIDISKYVILVTCFDVVNIYKQLEQIDYIKDIECYFYRMVLSFYDVDIDNFLKNEIKKKAYTEIEQRLKKYKDIHKGKRCFIIGNGPSLRMEDLNMLKDEITFAANSIYLMFDKTDWRPNNYLCGDSYAYRADYDLIENLDIPNKFISLSAAFKVGKLSDKVLYFKTSSDKTNIINGKIEENKLYSFSYDITDGINYESTVLYSAVQIAVYMGFTEIYLLGVDCNYNHELLQDGTCKVNNINDYFDEEATKGYEKYLSIGVPVYAMQRAWKSAKEACEKVGVTIKNATRGGKLEVFERVNFDELIKYK